MCRIENELAEEQAKHDRWHKENIRRRHNYFPFIFNMLRLLGEEGRLQPLIQIAKTQKKETT